LGWWIWRHLRFPPLGHGLSPRARTVVVRDVLKPEATKKLGQCQVGSRTDHPCPRQAVVEIRGVPFCERCAREQEAYFAIGEMSRN
jgi:hypothetical protein